MRRLALSPRLELRSLIRPNRASAANLLVGQYGLLVGDNINDAVGTARVVYQGPRKRCALTMPAGCPMELNAGNGIVGVRLGELVMTPLGFKGLDIRSRPLTFQRSLSSAALVGTMSLLLRYALLAALALTRLAQRSARSRITSQTH